MRILTMLVLALTLGAASTVRAQEYTPVDNPAQRYTFIGGSVLPPGAAGWRFRRHTGELQLEFASGSDSHHTWVAVVSSYNTRDIDTTLSLSLLEQLARHRALEGQGRPMTPKSFEATADSTIAPLAVRYHYRVEDRDVPSDKGKVYDLEGQGLLLVHPDLPHLVIALEYSERAESSIAMMHSAMGDSFLAHLVLTRSDTAAVRRLDIGGRPFLVVSAPEAIWVGCWRHPEGGKSGKNWSEVLRLDPSSLAIQARAHLDWVASDLVATAEGIWVSGYRTGILQRLDPATLATTATVDKGGSPERMLATSGALWVSDPTKGTLESVDLNTLKVDHKRIPGLERPFTIVEADGLLWILDAERVVSLDPRTRALVGSPIPLAQRPGLMVYGDGSLWVWSMGTRIIQRIDPSKRAVVATIPMDFPISDMAFNDTGPLPTSADSGGGRRAGGLWLASSSDGRLVVIDPSTNRIAGKSVSVGPELVSIAASEHAMYVADRTSGTIARVALP